MSPLRKFQHAADALLKSSWKQYPNPLDPDPRPKYPGRMTVFVAVLIDGRTMPFRIQITPFFPMKSPLTLQNEAAERTIARRGRSNKEQLAKLDRRSGEAKRERARLNPQSKKK